MVCIYYLLKLTFDYVLFVVAFLLGMIVTIRSELDLSVSVETDNFS